MTSHHDQPGTTTPASTDADSRCWVICPTGTPSPATYTGNDDEYIPHYASREQAAAEISDLADTAVQLPQACYVHSCDCCHQDLIEDDHGGALHWITPADALREASYWDWTSDGRDWHCPECPPLATSEQTAGLAWLPADPGPGAQLLPAMGITSADVGVLGPAGVIPEQVTTFAEHAAGLGDGDDGDGVA